MQQHVVHPDKKPSVIPTEKCSKCTQWPSELAVKVHRFVFNLKLLADCRASGHVDLTDTLKTIDFERANKKHGIGVCLSPVKMD